MDIVRYRDLKFKLYLFYQDWKKGYYKLSKIFLVRADRGGVTVVALVRYRKSQEKKPAVRRVDLKYLRRGSSRISERPEYSER